MARGVCALGIGLEVRLHIGAEMARPCDDAHPRQNAGVLILLQCGFGIRVCVERLRERERVFSSLRNTRADMRARHESRIAEDCHAAKRHVRHFEIVNRLQKRLGTQADHLVELRRQHPFGIQAHRGDHVARDQRRRDRERMRAADVVGE